MKEESEIHSHCKDCIKIRKCSVEPKNGESCKIVACSLNCGAKFHSCKKEEHRLLCLNERVPCINQFNGCPAKMLRKHIGIHLSTCPASVIHCKMEWNRWPVHFPHQVKLQNQRPLHDTQLDVALAMRDQRMLQQSLQMSSQYALCSSPIKYSSTQLQNRSQIELTPEKLNVGCYVNGVQDENERGEVFSNYICAKESFKGDWVKKQCASCDDILFVNNMTVSDISSAPLTESVHASLNSFPLMPDGLYITSSSPSTGLSLNLETRSRHQSKSKSMFTFVCGQDFRRDEYCWHYKNVHSDIHGGLNGWIEQRCPLAVYGCTFAHRRLNPMPKGSVIIHSDQSESFGLQPPPPRLSVPTVPSEKTTSEHRSSSEENHQSDSDLSTEIENSLSVHPIHIHQLPFVILQHIASYLDSFSLSSLALTSVILRDVCSSLLEERGIVVFRWERYKVDDKYTWKISDKRWFFSTSFTPIQEWFFEDSSISNHLRICPMFQRNVRLEPYFCTGLEKFGRCQMH